MPETSANGDFETQPLGDFTEKAYLDYAMYVILDRALPHVGDGMKPVQRRIVYAMSQLALGPQAKYKKSARTIGDVLGKYHPHGDSACYEAMVLMAQPFSYRYPLIDGQGNWGSQDDPKSFAAMRYTEARLTRHAQLLLDEVDQGTVDWVDNFDGTLSEPKVLPARLPEVLLNGATGIAVGMATDIPPHNLRDVAAACCALLDAPETDTAALVERIQGPDLPTGAAVVTPPAELKKIYETGGGNFRMRARYQVENGDLVLTALPYQVSGNKILEQIAAQMQAKKLPMVTDLRDESDHQHPVRLVIQLKGRKVDPERLMEHLFATTDLERSYRVNLNLIGLDGRPRVYNLRDLLTEWLQFRRTTVTRRLQHRLEQVTDRLHVLEGLLIAYLNIDEVIAVIREADEPKAALIERFELTERQAEAILQLRLRQLAKLEEIKIRGEKDALEAERQTLEATLGSEDRLTALIRQEIVADAESFGDDRQSPLEAREAAKALDEAALVSAEPVTVVLSERGWVRTAKGHEVDPEKLTYKAGDGFLAAAQGQSNRPAIFLDSSGRVYNLPAHELPSARSQGEPLSGRLAPPDGVRFRGVLMGADEDWVLLATDAGYGFRVRLGELLSRNKAGKAALTVPAGAEVLPPVTGLNPTQDEVVVVTRQGRLLAFPAGDLPALAKGRGNRLIQPDRQGDAVVALCTVDPASPAQLTSGRRTFTLKPADRASYRGARGSRGRLLPQGFRQVSAIREASGGQ